MTAAISDELPCGPDLEEEDDAYIAFTSTIEVVLPADYMLEDHEGEMLPFHSHLNFEGLDLSKWIISARTLCARTHDLRILTVLARLYILNRSLSDFEGVVEAMATLLEAFWNDVHPRPEPDGGAARTAAIERLNEPLIVDALQHAPLFTSRRHGALTLQAYKAAVRKASGSRDGADTNAVDHVLSKECSASPELLESIRGTTDRLARALTRIRTAFLDHSTETGPKLDRIGGTVAQLQALFERIQPTASPPAIDGAAPGEAAPQADASRDAQPVEGAGGAIRTSFEAREALDAAIAYLSHAEPSSPALLLLRQAQSLVGKPFLDALRALFPEQVRYAGVSIAAPSIFRLPLTQLAENSPPPDGDDGAATASAEGPSIPVPQSRAEALRLLDAVVSYYRTAEPSSPIPMLLERARPLLGQDFMKLVRSMLPAGVLSEE